jgi:lactobin A/cerein 7B family class IIb bacteriocin
MTKIKNFKEISYDELMSVNGGLVPAGVIVVGKFLIKTGIYLAASYGTKKALDAVFDDSGSSGSSN